MSNRNETQERSSPPDCQVSFTRDAPTSHCRPCTECGENARVKSTCNSTRDTRCECDKDHYWDSGKRQCLQCDLCPHGWGAVRACSLHRNSACRRCAPGTYSALLSPSLACFPCTTCKSWQKVIQPCSRIHDTVCSDNEDVGIYAQKVVPKVQQTSQFTSTSREMMSSHYLWEETDHSVWPIYCALLGALVLAVVAYVSLKRWRFKSSQLSHRLQFRTRQSAVRAARNDVAPSSGFLGTHIRDVCETKRKILEMILTETYLADDSGWRGLAKELGYDDRLIMDLEKRCRLKNGGVQHVVHLLRDWSRREDATLFRLIAVLHRLGHVAAVHLLLSDHVVCCSSIDSGRSSLSSSSPLGSSTTGSRPKNGPPVSWQVTFGQSLGDVV